MQGLTPAFSRVMPLERGFNLRDFGGYATMDGRVVKQGKLFRSGTMALLTPADEEKLRELHIRVICDLRLENERLAQPTRWHEAAGANYWCRDYTETTGVVADQLRNEAATQDDIRRTMIALYRQISVDQAPAYREIFNRLAHGELPILINCTGGKDRTGICAALILSVLGVSQDLIKEDYVATNIHADWEMLFAHMDISIKEHVHSNAGAQAQLLSADPVYVDALFAWLNFRYGGIEPYLACIGVKNHWLVLMREALIEP